MLILALTLALLPWTGRSLPKASPGANVYKLTIAARPLERVELEVVGAPPGWVASFCTPRICSPYRYAFRVSRRGTATLEFQALRTQTDAPAHVRLTLLANRVPQRTVNVTDQMR